LIIQQLVAILSIAHFVHVPFVVAFDTSLIVIGFRKA